MRSIIRRRAGEARLHVVFCFFYMDGESNIAPTGGRSPPACGILLQRDGRRDEVPSPLLLILLGCLCVCLCVCVSAISSRTKNAIDMRFSPNGLEFMRMSIVLRNKVSDRYFGHQCPESGHRSKKTLKNRCFFDFSQKIKGVSYVILAWRANTM